MVTLNRKSRITIEVPAVVERVWYVERAKGLGAVASLEEGSALKFLLPPSALAGRAPSASGALQVWRQEGSSREETVPFWGKIAGMLMSCQR